MTNRPITSATVDCWRFTEIAFWSRSADSLSPHNEQTFPVRAKAPQRSQTGMALLLGVVGGQGGISYTIFQDVPFTGSPLGDNIRKPWVPVLPETPPSKSQPTPHPGSAVPPT